MVSFFLHLQSMPWKIYRVNWSRRLQKIKTGSVAQQASFLDSACPRVFLVPPVGFFFRSVLPRICTKPSLCSCAFLLPCWIPAATPRGSGSSTRRWQGNQVWDFQLFNAIMFFAVLFFLLPWDCCYGKKAKSGDFVYWICVDHVEVERILSEGYFLEVSLFNFCIVDYGPCNNVGWHDSADSIICRSYWQWTCVFPPNELCALSPGKWMKWPIFGVCMMNNHINRSFTWPADRMNESVHFRPERQELRRKTLVIYSTRIFLNIHRPRNIVDWQSSPQKIKVYYWPSFKTKLKRSIGTSTQNSKASKIKP